MADSNQPSKQVKEKTSFSRATKRRISKLRNVTEEDFIEFRRKQVEQKKNTDAPRSKVHRCRFIDFVPDAIHALAARVNPINGRQEIAVGRAFGDIEIWDVQTKTRRTLVPSPRHGEQNALRCLLWIDNNTRLFGATLGGVLFEVNETSYLNVAPSNGGPVWGMDSFGSDHIAAACEDGKIHLFDSSLNQLKTLDAAAGRAIAVVFKDSKDHLFSSHADAIIRRWVNGRVVVNMMISSADSVNCVIWTLVALKKSDILFSGDSYGFIHVWDTNSGVVLQKFSQHRADVLAIAVTKDEKRMFASGIDNRVAMFSHSSLVEKQEDNNTLNRENDNYWSYVYSHGPHTHDIRSLCILENDSYLVSGGVDTTLGIFKVDQFVKIRPKKCSPVFTTQVCKQSLLLLARQSRWCELWSIMNGSEVKLGMFTLSGHSGIRFSAICSSWLALGESDDRIRIFRLKGGGEPNTSDFLIETPKFIDVDDAQMIAFSGTTSLLVASSPTLITIISLGNDIKEAGRLETSKTTTATILGFCASSSWAATLDSCNTIRVFSIDTGKQFAKLVDCSAQYIELVEDNILMFCTEKGAVSAYFIENKVLKVINPYPLENVKGFSAASEQKYVVYGENYLRLGIEKLSIRGKYNSIVTVGYSKDNEMVIVEAPWLKVMKHFPEILDQHKFNSKLSHYGQQ